MSSKPPINRLMELQQLLIAFGAIDRVMYLPNRGDRRESDTDHSYALAMTAWFLAPHFPHLDATRMLKLALAHDVVEVHAGDTFVYGAQEHIDTKTDREQIALERLQEEWPDFPEMTDAIKEYSQKSSEEAKFIYALDKILPPMLHILGDGKTWKEHNVTFDMFTKLQASKIAKDSLVYPYFEKILAFLQTKPHLFSKP